MRNVFLESARTAGTPFAPALYSTKARSCAKLREEGSSRMGTPDRVRPWMHRGSYRGRASLSGSSPVGRPKLEAAPRPARGASRTWSPRTRYLTVATTRSSISRPPSTYVGSGRSDTGRHESAESVAEVRKSAAGWTAAPPYRMSSVGPASTASPGSSGATTRKWCASRRARTTAPRAS